MVTVQFVDGSVGHVLKEADSFYFHEGILYVTRRVSEEGTGDKYDDRVAAYPQVGVAGVEKTECCCKD